ncbi:MAG: hypothetical protein DME23_19595 [Verrucomicrobia bacterium]|nr:MAG: hypothetical protein DME23_19595 [Verrucomicrobiota bacterium]
MRHISLVVVPRCDRFGVLLAEFEPWHANQIRAAEAGGVDFPFPAFLPVQLRHHLANVVGR